MNEEQNQEQQQVFENHSSSSAPTTARSAAATLRQGRPRSRSRSPRAWRRFQWANVLGEMFKLGAARRQEPLNRLSTLRPS